MEVTTHKCRELLQVIFPEMKADQNATGDRRDSDIQSSSFHAFSSVSKSSNIHDADELISESSENSEETSFVRVQSLEVSDIQECIKYMYPHAEILGLFTEEVHQFLTGLPSSSNSHRSAVRDYVTSLIQSALNCSVFDLSNYTLTPTNDEAHPINLYVIVGKSYQHSWYSIVLDHISSMDNTTSSIFTTVSDLIPSKNISVSHADINQFSETCLEKNPAILIVAKGITVRVYSDPAEHLCFNGFIEEVSILIGNNHLLQRTFLLCRLFLEQQLAQIIKKRKMETFAFEYILDDEILWVLVLMVFNKHNTSIINNPLQCLFLLLLEMVNYNPAFHAITIFGLIDLSSAALRESTVLSDGHRISIPVEKFCLPFLTLEKYMNLANAQDLATLSFPFQSENPVSLSFIRSSATLILPSIKLSDLSPTKFLVIHPISQKFVCSSAYLLKTSNQSLSDLFHFGIARFINIFTKVKEYRKSSFELLPSIKVQMLKEFMLNVAIPDNLYNAVSSLTEEGGVTLLRSIHFSISYCHLIYKGIVSDSSLLFAVIEALELKGALPVGEVGKVMAIHGEPATIAKFIKDRYGGLKKYLERYPALFVFGDDHEFNPHVFLIFKISSAHKAMIDNRSNIISMEYLVQYRQVILSLPLIIFLLRLVSLFRPSHQEKSQNSWLLLRDKRMNLFKNHFNLMLSF
jgi:hypothetical protein